MCDTCGFADDRCPPEWKDEVPPRPMQAVVMRIVASPGEKAWTKNSLSWETKVMADKADHIRRSYTKTMVNGAEYLAQAHDAAAKAFRDALDALGA